ncbi:Bro-N domain-containing protein [Aeromonas veronii]|uniref:BRO-N domain-containing protein n=1 Tax=Aeromonas veronii TaxID=654 RepID=UPI0021D853A7|nr:Bro-N domain-containing protein [Aeromonas veronii]UYB71571.1 Bro-N domain-containing protein [Aeromonas veronii]
MQVLSFDSAEFGKVRLIQEEGRVLFCAVDVCKALGYSNARDAVRRHVDEGDVVKRDTPTTSGVQEVSFLDEGGVYALIFGSKLPAAKSFKRWVTGEVLPSLRKTGQYQVARPAVNVEAVQVELLFVETAARMLNVSNSGKLGMLQTIQRQHGLPNLLPSYAIDAPSDATDGSSRPTFSATEGLKQHGVNMAARYFNALLESKGLLVKMQRPSSKTPEKQREFWSITAAGLRYGKNIVDPRYQRETAPHWYQSRFADLLAKVGLGKVAA